MMKTYYEDCISRKQALEEINRTVFCYTHQARQIIEDLPSIQPKTKTDVIDKIRAEIEKAVWEDVVSLDGTDEIRIPTLNPDDVFKIIDKYKAEKG